MGTHTITPKPNLQHHAPGSERKVWEDLLADREVIERLRITSDELQALSRVSFLGAVKCKEDFLFILRQMREAADSEPARPMLDEPRLEPIRPTAKPKTARMLKAVHRRSASAPAAVGRDVDHGSLAEITRRRTPEQFGVFALMMLVIAIALWVLSHAIFSWRHSFDTKVGVASYRNARGVAEMLATAGAATTEVEVS